MKKVVFVFFLLMLGLCGDSFSQSGIPQNSSISRYHGRKYVRHFQSEVGDHPSSFLIRSKGGLATYLDNSFATLENAYLHIYYGIDGGGKKCLVIVGTVLTTDPMGNPILTHKVDNQGDRYIWATMKGEPNCCVPFDSSIDYIDHNDTPPCDISNCGTGIIDDGTAKQYLRSFQENDGNIFDPQQPSFTVTESYLVSANSMRTYLRNYQEVMYMQFYIGVDRLATFENSKLVMIGVDAAGHHVWDVDGEGKVSMFDETYPCPKCKVITDAKIDFHHQDGTPMN